MQNKLKHCPMLGFRGGGGGGAQDPDPPWKITSYIGFYREKAMIGPPPFGKSWTLPLENVGPHPWKMSDPLWNLGKL